MSDDAIEDEQRDEAVLALLVKEPRVWTLEEVKREISNPIAAEDSVARLHGAGLVNQFDASLTRFVFASRAALHAP